MASGGYRPGAGRPKGTKKITEPKVKGSARGKSLPVNYESAMDYAMKVINDPAADIVRKDRLAIALLPFQHAKLEAVALGKREVRAQAAKSAASGRFGPPPPPKLVVDNEC